MSKNNNPFVRFVRLAIIVGGSLLLPNAIWALCQDVPDWRYALLFGLAMALSWPRLKLPINSAEVLVFLTLLIYGSPAAMLLAAMVSVVTYRKLLKVDRVSFFVRLGQTILSSAIAGFILTWLLRPQSSLGPPTSVSLINALAWIAWIRFLFHANWLEVFNVIRAGKIWENFTQGHWVNSFISYFAAAVTAGIVSLIVKQQPPYVEVLSLLVITIFYFAYRHFKEKYIYDTQELSKLHLRTIEALASAIEAKDHRATTQAQRVQNYTESLGKALDLSEPELQGLRAASLLRDIGKLAVPDYILHKSGNLTEAEIEKIKLHPVIGASILERAAFPYPLVPAVKHHHEHWDGTGYPDQLRGEQIPITARILAVVDAFDEAYGDGTNQFAKDDAVKLLLKESGHKYDPQVVQAFLDKLPTFVGRTNGINPVSIPYALDSITPSLPVSAENSNGSQDRYLKEIRQAHQEGTELLYLAQTLSSTLNLEEAVAIIVSRISRLITFDTGAIYLCDEKGVSAYVAGAVGMHAEKLRQHQAIVGKGVVGQALASGETVFSADPASEFAGLEPVVQQVFKTMMVYPLTKAGRIIGAISLLSTHAHSFTMEHQRVIAMVEPLAADALFNSMTYLRTEARALTDALTGLPNSRALITYFDQESNRAERYGATLAMLMIDLDGFKQVNDTFGHQAGDTVLREIAMCLKKELRAGDPLIRYAGDEFIALLPHAEESSINDLIARIQKYLEAYSILLNGIEVHIGASVGYAMYGRDGHTLDELMKVADEGMYSNKAQRKRQIRPKLVHPSAASETTTEINISLKEAVAS